MTRSSTDCMSCARTRRGRDSGRLTSTASGRRHSVALAQRGRAEVLAAAMTALGVSRLILRANTSIRRFSARAIACPLILGRALRQRISYGRSDPLGIARVRPCPFLDLRVVAGVAYRTLPAIERCFQHGDLLFGQLHRASHVAREPTKGGHARFAQRLTFGGRLCRSPRPGRRGGLRKWVRRANPPGIGAFDEPVRTDPRPTLAASIARRKLGKRSHFFD
jgi:hypothetical protein